MKFPIKLNPTLDNSHDLPTSQPVIFLVPCLADLKSNTFQPLLHNTCQEIQQSTTKTWSKTEDSVLLSIISMRGPRAWALCAEELNSLCHQGIRIRKGWNCRDRWFNHLDPSIKRADWAKEEDGLILQEQSRGNRWSEIAKKLEGRSEKAVKKRFKVLAARMRIENRNRIE